MIFPWFSVLAEAPGFYTTLTQRHYQDYTPEFMYEDPKCILGEEYFHHISGDSTVYGADNIDWLKCEADCRFPLTIAHPGSWYKRSRFSVVP